MFAQLISSLGIGEVIRVNRGTYFHYAIVADYTAWGEPILWSISGIGGHRFAQTLSELTQGHKWENEGYWGTLSPDEVLQRALDAASRNYQLAQWNCEHFVRYAHGLPPESPQIQRVARIAMLLTLSAVGVSLYRRADFFRHRRY